MSEEIPPHVPDHQLDGWAEVLADIELAVEDAGAAPEARAALARGFRRGYGMRDALLKRTLDAEAPLPQPLVGTILVERATALREVGELEAARGYAFAALVTALDAHAPDHPQGERVAALRRRAAAILDAVGPEVAEERSVRLKGPDVSTTRH